MASDRFIVYGKPLLKLKNGDIVVNNIPVPRRSFAAPWLMENINVIQSLRSIQLATAVLRRLHLSSPSDAPAVDYRSTHELLMKIFENLDRVNRDKNSTFVIVYLPTLADLTDDKSANSLREYLSSNLIMRKIHFIDLAAFFQPYSYAKIRSFYFPPHNNPYAIAGGHYTIAGNKEIGKLLYDRLAAIPELGELMRRKQ